MSSAINSINSLLRGITHGQVSYSSDYRKNTINLQHLNSFQHDEIWDKVKGLLPTISSLICALDRLHDLRIANSVSGDLRVVLFEPEKINLLLKSLEINPPQHLYVKKLVNWLNDIRENVYSLMSLSCNLSDTFFQSDSKFILETIFSNIGGLPPRFLKSLTEKIISPFTIRCCGVVPQYFGSFMAPILSHFFQSIFQRLCSDWNKVVTSSTVQVGDVDCTAEVESQDMIRQLTRSLSKLIFSFTLEIFLNGVFERNNNTKKIRGNKRNNRNKNNRNKDNERFRLNKVLMNQLLNTKSVFDPLYQIFVFLMKCPDSIARNNIYRYLFQMVSIVDNDPKFLRLLAGLMIEALKIQSTIKEVDSSLVDFFAAIIRRLVQKNSQISKAELRKHISLYVPEEDTDFLLNAFLARDKSLQKKKTKQFLMKVSGEDATEIIIEKRGVLTNSVSKKGGRKGNGRRGRTNYMEPVDISFLFEEENSS